MTDEHTNENIIRNKSDEYWYSNVSKKTPRERFSFLFIDTNYPTVFFVGDVWAQRKYRANSQFDFHCIPFSFVIDHFPDLSFSLLFAYAFSRVSSSFHPVSFYTITHAFTRAPSCRGLENYVSRADHRRESSIAIFLVILYTVSVINSRMLTANFR